MNRYTYIALLVLVGAGAYLVGYYRASHKYQDAQAKFYASVLTDNLSRTQWFLSLDNDERTHRLRRSARALSEGLEDVMVDWDAFVRQSHVDIMELHSIYRSEEEMLARISEVLERWGYNEEKPGVGAVDSGRGAGGDDRDEELAPRSPSHFRPDPR